MGWGDFDEGDGAMNDGECILRKRCFFLHALASLLSSGSVPSRYSRRDSQAADGRILTQHVLRWDNGDGRLLLDPHESHM